jgi:phage shock protein A
VLRATDAALADLPTLDFVSRSAHPTPAARTDDPREQLARAARELAEQVEEVRRGAAAEMEAADEWERRARLAILDEREDLARQSLDREQQHRTAARLLLQEQAQLEWTLARCNDALAALGPE